MKDEPELFSLTLNEGSSDLINRIYRQARWIYWIGFVLSLVFIVDSVRRSMRVMDYGIGGWMATVIKFYPAYLILGSILYYLQIRAFFLFASKARRAVTEQETNVFNQALSQLIKANTFHIIQITSQLIIHILITWIDSIMISSPT